MPVLSVIIPVFNERETVGIVVQNIVDLKLPDWKKEIIVVDDGSSDGTAETLRSLVKKQKGIILITHPKNKGKGAAVRSGIARAAGDYLIIQDADLEYDPKDIPKLLDPIFQKKTQVVFGTRLNRLPNLTRDENRPRFLLHYFGNRALSFLTGLLYNHALTDLETGYKVFPKNAVKNEELSAVGFEFEPEITILLLKKRYTIVEVPIRTTPRGYEKGKKLKTVPDGLKALRMIISKKL